MLRNTIANEYSTLKKKAVVYLILFVSKCSRNAPKDWQMHVFSNEVLCGFNSLIGFNGTFVNCFDVKCCKSFNIAYWLQVG